MEDRETSADSIILRIENETGIMQHTQIAKR